MRTKLLAGSAMAMLAIGFIGIKYYSPDSNQEHPNVNIPENLEYEEYNEEEFKKKMAEWSAEDAIRQQKILKQTRSYFQNSVTRAVGDEETFGTLKGSWYNRAPNNMPGAFKFADMLDGTDTIYGITHNHYSGEFNSKSYIFRGTVYNPKTGAKGDDFERLTGHWPNRYKDFVVYRYNGSVRLLAGIENGPVYYSDDEGQNWNLSSGLPNSLSSTIVNRQDGRVYTTNGYSVYVSTDGGTSFSTLETLSGYGDAVLYSPRYDVQPDAEKVYMAREGVFYELNAAKTSFTSKGSYTSSHGSSALSIGGDSRKLYVTENKAYWSSTNSGASWSTKSPKGNWYGDRTGAMSAGKYIGVSPENPEHVMGGYAQPVYSTDGLNTDNSTTSGWGNYQNGTSLSLSAYKDRIRFNYHPDIQASQFFYNASGDLISVASTDGGLFMSYRAWYDHPTDNGGSYDNSGYANAHFININTVGTPCALIYRHNMFTGYKNTDHIVFSTQDQGTQDYIGGTSGDTIHVYQTIGGDGPPLNSADGNWVWKWKRQGSQVWIPEELYDISGNRRSIGAVKGDIEANNSVTFTEDTRVGWSQAYIDRDEPDKRIWMLNKSLSRAEVSGTAITGTTVSKGTGHQVCALTQSVDNPDHVWFLQEGTVYKSTNRGDSFDNGTSTPFTKTSNNQNIGNGWALPGNGNWVLFAGPSGNGVGSILSKDGGSTWNDVTGDFPSGDDFQVGGMVGTPDGNYVFAGTDVGPYVFVVSEEKWYPLFGGEAAMFNTMGVEYIASTNTVRFGTWGSGVWDFTIDDGTPVLNLNAMGGTQQTCDSLIVTWSTNIEDGATVKLLQNSSEVESWNVADAQDYRFAWLISDGYTTGSDYQVSITSGGLTKTSNVFSITTKMQELASTRLTAISVDSEHSSDRLASATVDEDDNTFWHTEWSPNTPGFPHTIVYESDTIAEWVAFTYQPRMDGSSNGRVANYKIYGSTDNVIWTELKSGTLANIGTAQTVVLDLSMECKYIKFEALSEVSGGFYASMSEFNVHYKEICGTVTNTSNIEGVNDISINAVLPGRLLDLSVPQNGSYNIRVVSMGGKLLWKSTVELTAGNHKITLPYKLKRSKLIMVTVQSDHYVQHRNMIMRK